MTWGGDGGGGGERHRILREHSSRKICLRMWKEANIVFKTVSSCTNFVEDGRGHLYLKL